MGGVGVLGAMLAIVLAFSLSIEDVLGLHVSPADLSFGQMSARTLVVIVWGVIIVRLGDRRFLGKNAGFDMLLVVILGSVLSRAVNGQAAFFPTLGASGVLLLIHHLLAWATLRSKSLSRIVKGRPLTLVEHGRVNKKEMDRAKITVDDLDENLRLNGNIADVKQVCEARLERNGTVSVIKDPYPAAEGGRIGDWELGVGNWKLEIWNSGSGLGAGIWNFKF
jgi:uncharacterized membrane protein YcaP (DUF421 family)